MLMYQQFFVLFENRFFEKYMENYLISVPFLKKAKTWRYIKISTRQHTRKVTTSYLLSTFELLTIFEKSKYRNISKLNLETDFVRGYTKNCTIPYSQMFHIFWYIKHRGIYIRKFASSFVCRGATSYNFVHLSTLSRVERIRIGSREMCIVVRNTIQIMLGTFITRSFFSEWRRRINRSSFAQYIPDLLFRCHARDVAPSDKGN